MIFIKNIFKYIIGFIVVTFLTILFFINWLVFESYFYIVGWIFNNPEFVSDCGYFSFISHMWKQYIGKRE